MITASLVLAATLAVRAQGTPDSTYASRALRELVERAAQLNHAPPPAFRGYRARTETEVSLILRDTLGRENAAQIEQLASVTEWRPAGYEMHVAGYRSQGAGVPYSTLSFIRGWTVPSLYGERLRLGVLSAPAQPPRRSTTAPPRDTLVAIHPFARDRDRYYRYSGGDTIAVLRTQQRILTIVRIRVIPRLNEPTLFAALDGEIHVDAERGQIVRMRGQMIVRGVAPRQPRWTRLPGIVGVAYIDFTNAEVNGAYWLPASQRTEFQSSIAVLGNTRALMRIVSEFSDYAVDDQSGALRSADMRGAQVTTWAPSDSISHFSGWQSAIGTLTGSVTANDFDDVAPDIWRATGPPRFDLFPTRTDNLIGFNRVEGLYTGVEGTLRLRDAFPGLSLNGRAGWAWSERTARGGAAASLHRAAWTYGIKAERVLASTNDFRHPLDPESGGIPALLGANDDFDYVDRRRAVASVTHVVGTLRDAFFTVQAGVVHDAAESAHTSHGLFGGSSFRINRGVTPGTYALMTGDLEIHPNVSADFVEAGVGARFHHESATGGLNWQRSEVGISTRQYVGPLAIVTHTDAGIVYGGSVPPQALFELGGNGTLAGYGYKQFVGDRAALFRTFASYTLPIARTPIRVLRNFLLPGIAPGFGIGASGGWTELSSNAATTSASALGVSVEATHGTRATVGAGLTFFGGNAHVYLARPVDHGAPWKQSVGIGPEF